MTQTLKPDNTRPTAADDGNPVTALKQGLAHEMDDMVKLELTAEQMLQDEARLMFDYVAEDAKSWWGDVKGGVREWELAAGDLLLSAADPTSVEWQLGQWWSEKPYLYHRIK